MKYWMKGFTLLVLLMSAMLLVVACTEEDNPADPVGGGELALSVTTMNFSAQVDNATFFVINAGTAGFDWTAASTAAWMMVAPSTGTLAVGDSAEVMITINRSGMAEGTYGGSINVTASGLSASLTATMDVAGEAPFDIVEVVGVVELPDGVDIELTDLNVISFADQGEVGADGGFAVDVVDDIDGPAMFFLTQFGNAFPVLIGLLEDENGEVEFSVETTIVALSLLNPNLFGTTPEERELYVWAVRNNPDFAIMVLGLTAIYQEDGAQALNFDVNPEVFQNLAELMRSTMIQMGGGAPAASVDEVAPPYLMGGAGGNLSVMNPTFATYGLGVYQDQTIWTGTHTVARRTEQVELWGWPPLMMHGDQETQISLADGIYRIHLNRGPNFLNITNWDDEAGRATLLNSSDVVLSIVDLIAGQLPIYPDADDLVGHLSVSATQAGDIARGISQYDETDVLVNYLDIVNSNSESLAGWMWHGTQSLAAEIYLAVASDIMKDISFTFDLLSYQNATGPFVYDLVHAVDQLNYIVSIDGGVVTVVDEDLAPEATFFVDPPAGVIETVFTFNASLTVDDLTPFEDLRFRWDFNGDGTFETNWSNDYMATHSYEADGSYDVVLQVIDTSDLVGVAGGIVNVGGGAGTATHVKLFRDNLPWNSSAMDNMLISLGFTEGVGPNTYEILSSTEFGTASITAGEDLVIISNDQSTAFYENYAANMARFNNFVYMGGSIFWEACDQGWQGGSMETAGVVFPGNVGFEYAYENYNYIVNPLLPLVADLPQTMDHNYASHEAFVNLQLGTTIYMEDSREIPTLIEYSLGAGWVLMSGQPLEHQVDNNWGEPNDMSQLLPRIVSYFLGVEEPAGPMAYKPRPSTRSSAYSDTQ
jgi:Viral BACON domain/PKD domain